MECLVALLLFVVCGTAVDILVCLRLQRRVEELEVRVGNLGSADGAHEKRLAESRECGTQTAREVDELKRRLEVASIVLAGDYDVRDEEPDNE